MEKNYNKNYVDKISKKFQYLSNVKDKQKTAEDFNAFICLLNYCFLNKNNFFIKDFNMNVISTICKTYNTIKTNILRQDRFDLFENVKESELKSIRFIITNAINNYNNIDDLCKSEIISKESLKGCLNIVNSAIKRF